MSCYECAGRVLVSTCPLCAVEDVPAEITAHEQGYEARLCCHGHDENPFHAHLQPEDNADWLRGWNDADNEPD